MSKIESSPELIDSLLRVLQDNILPLTEAGVLAGNKIFGAALLRKSDLSCYLAETNNEIQSPLHHGEMHLLKRYHEQDEGRRRASGRAGFSIHPRTLQHVFVSNHLGRV